MGLGYEEIYGSVKAQLASTSGAGLIGMSDGSTVGIFGNNTNTNLKYDTPFINYSTVTDQNISIGQENKDVNGATNGGGVAIGYGALKNNAREEDDVTDEARFNTAIGSYSMNKNTTGNHNTAVGYQSGKENITGYENVFVGENAGFSNANAQRDTYVGARAGQSSPSGWYNTCIGGASYYNLDSPSSTTPTGNFNTGLGALSGFNHQGGSNNTYIGYRASKLASLVGTAISNVSVLGANAKSTRSNQVVLGDDNVSSFKLGGTERTITNSTDTGVKGEMCWDADYIYLCVDTDTWKRFALITW